MRAFSLIGAFMRASAQQDLAYRANFWLSLLNSVLNLVVGLAGLQVLFSQVESLAGWSYASALAVLGVYLVVGALRALFIGPSLEALAGLGQEIWNGNFDFSLLRPLDTQFLVTFRTWHWFSLVDLAFGVGVVVAACVQGGQQLSLGQVFVFFCALLAAVLVLYALQLTFAALAFWNSAVLLTWVLDAIFQLARYPVQLYPGWLQFVLTWLVPVGIITTVPAQALTGTLPVGVWLASLALAGFALVFASWLFHRGLRKYASASS